MDIISFAFKVLIQNIKRIFLIFCSYLFNYVTIDVNLIKDLIVDQSL